MGDCRERLRGVAILTEATIASAGLTGAYAELLRLALAPQDRALSAEVSARWPLVTLAACECASGGRWEPAVPVAASISSLAAALELLDDLQDGDANPLIERCGPAQAANVSTGLLMLSQRLLWRLRDAGLAAERLAAIADDYSATALTVGGAQHLDLALEGQDGVDEKQALEIASGKSAALTALACRLGARVGTDDPDLVEALGQFGWHAGMAGQLHNDLHDASPEATGKSDLRRGKKTLPLVGAATFGVDLPGLLQTAGENELRRAVLASGAIHYTWVLADGHHREALRLLDGLDPSHPTNSLRLLVSPG